MTELAAAVIGQLQGRQPVDEREARAVQICVEELRNRPEVFDRDRSAVHVTGSGVVVGPRGVLLLLHRKLRIWVQPGGHLEAGEAPWDAARRETEEETGLTVVFAGRPPGAAPALLHVDVHDVDPRVTHVHLDLRYLLAVSGDDQPRPPSGESPDVRWVPWAEAVGLADPGLAGLLAHLAPRRPGAG